MTDPILRLADDFAPADAARWRALVDKVLKGAPFDKRLVSRTDDGLAVQPLYTRADEVAAAPVARAPRGPEAAGGWDIRQWHADSDPAAANTAILEDLAGGATSILLQVAAPGWSGLDYRQEAMARALAGVVLDVCPVALKAGEYTPDAAGSLMALWRAAGLDADTCRGAFNYDPIGTLAETGALYHPLDRALATAADLVKTATAFRGVRALLADGTVWHNAGATEAQEIGLVLATVVAYARACERDRIAPAAALGKVAVSIAVDADQFLGIAKVRALRHCLARIADATGAGGAAIPVGAVTSWRMTTRRDPWVNMLRTTMACAAAAVGGAESITVLPFTVALGRPDAFARRIARNTQIVLQEESGLGRVDDPAAGAWSIDTLTDELARAAWTLFQDTERAGGIGTMLSAGTVQGWLATAAEARRDRLARGRIELTGTSAFPLLGDDGVTVAPWPAEVPSADLPGARVTPVRLQRIAAPFEALRDAADAARGSGQPARLFLATLGPLAVHGARAQWMRNFLAAGGIKAVGDDPLPTAADAVRAFTASGCAVACLASADDVYGDVGAATVAALKAAGATAVFIAGRLGDDAMAGLTAAGLDAAIYAGADRLALLARLHAALGIGPRAAA